MYPIDSVSQTESIGAIPSARDGNGAFIRPPKISRKQKSDQVTKKMKSELFKKQSELFTFQNEKK